MEFKKLDSKNIQLYDCYKITNIMYTNKVLNHLNKDKIVTFAKNKLEFIDWLMENKKETSYRNIKSFFTKVLLISELDKGKDLAYYSLNEVYEMIKRLADQGGVTESTYNNYMNILQEYIRWAYDKDFRLDIIKKHELKLSRFDVIDMSKMYKKILTQQEMIYFISKIDNMLVKIALLLATCGLTFNEVLNVKRSEFLDIRDECIIKLGDRDLKIPKDIFISCNYFAKSCYINLRVSRGRGKKMQSMIKEFRLNDCSSYLMRTRKNSRSKDASLPNCYLSRKISEELKNIACDCSYNDFRMSSMLNDFIFGLGYEKLSKKYNVSYTSDILFEDTHVVGLNILKEKLISLNEELIK